MAKVIDEKIESKNTPWEGYAGRRVEEYIKTALDNKAGEFYHDEENDIVLVFAGAAERDEYLDPETTEERRSELLLGSFEAPSTFRATLTLIDTPSSSYVEEGSTGNYVRAAYDIIDRQSGESAGDNATCTITFSRNGGQSIETISRNLSYGSQLNLNVDGYLQPGRNVITIGVVGVATKAATTRAVTINVVSLKLEDTFENIGHVYTQSESVSVPFSVTGSGLKTIRWFVDGILIDSLTDTITAPGTTSRSKEIVLSDLISQGIVLSGGRHNIQYVASVSENGVEFFSKVIFHDFIIADGTYRNVVFAVGFSYPYNTGIITNPLQEPVPLRGLTQYINYSLAYGVYNPTGGSAEISVAFEGKTDVYSVENGERYILGLNAMNAGTAALLFSRDTDSLTFNAIVAESSYQLQEITAGLAFAFSGSDRSNNSSNRDEWSYTDRQATFTGFAWNKMSGWVDGRLVIPNGATFSVDYSPLAREMKTAGGTFEFEFESRRVLDDNAVMCDLRKDGTGILITASEASITSRGRKRLSAKYKPGENIRVSFVVNKASDTDRYRRLIFIYINGILSGCQEYEPSDSFLSDAVLSLSGTEDATVAVRQMRFYSRALSMAEVLNNYILYRQTTEELVEAYDRNDILGSGDAPSSEKLSAQTPIIIVTGDVEKLQSFGPEDKGTYVKMEKIEVINLDDPTRNMVLEDVSMRCQGTSSMNYPRKNFRFYTQADSKDKTAGSYTTRMYDADGNELTGSDRVYAFKENAQPVKCWCLKADFAESSSTHNTGVARLWNDVMKNASMRNEDIDSRHYLLDIFPDTVTPCRTIAQQKAIDSGYKKDVRTTVDGFPIVLFYRQKASDALICLGKYNWNNDKSTESVYGFVGIPGFDNSKMECWEVKNGDYPENLFTSVADWNKNVSYEGTTMKAWQRAFESRYPDDGGEASEARRAQGALLTVATWINSTMGASKAEGGKMVVDDETLMTKFKTEKWLHLDVYKVAAYYIYLMRFGGVDQTVKNAMFTTEDGTHWYYINYDNDTVLGLDNTGALAFDYRIDRQSLVEGTTNHAYAGYSSVLWNNLEADDEFMGIVKKVDQALFDAGLTYDNCIAVFNELQSGKWSERLHNLDYINKYIDTLLDEGKDHTSKLQGARRTHRQWWMAGRFALWDALNVTGQYKKSSVDFLFNGNSGEYPVEGDEIRIKSASNGQVFGYAYDTNVRYAGVIVNKGETYVFKLNSEDPYYIGAWQHVFNAPYLKSIDLSALTRHFNSITFANVNSTAMDSQIEEVILGDANSEANEGSDAVTSNKLSGLGQLKFLKRFVMNKFNEVTSLNLSSNSYLEYIDVRNNAKLALVTLPESSPIKTLILPSSLQVLEMKDLGELTSLTVDGGWANVYRISIRGCEKLGVSYAMLKGWYDNKNSADEECGLTVYGLDWTGTGSITSAELLALGQLKKNGGTLNLRGKIRLSDEMTQEKVDAITEIFGGGCFSKDADLWIDAPAGVLLSGPSKIMEGDDGQFSVAVFGVETSYTVRYSISSGSRQGCSIDPDTGILTTTETGLSDTALSVSAYVKPEGASGRTVTRQVTIAQRVYPSATNASVSGPEIPDSGSKYQMVINAGVEITGEYVTEWSVRGDAAEYVTISSMRKTECVVAVSGGVPGEVTGYVDCVIKRVSDGTVKTTLSKSISVIDENIAFTSNTQPALMAKMYSKGFAANQNFMTKDECAALTADDLQPSKTDPSQSVFYNMNMTSFNEFVYFTGLTEIKKYTFMRAKFNSIVIPDTVTSIGDQAFDVCENLANIVIPNSVTTIGTYAFSQCKSLASVVIPDSVITIGTQLFADCISLISIHVGSGISTNAEMLLNGCTNIASITVSEGNTVYDSRNDCNAIIKTSSNTLILGCKNTVIPNTVTGIDTYAFARTKSAPTSVVIPDSVTSIGYHAFENLENIESIMIGSGVASIDTSFFKCTNIASITVS